MSKAVSAQNTRPMKASTEFLSNRSRDSRLRQRCFVMSLNATIGAIPRLLAHGTGSPFPPSVGSTIESPLKSVVYIQWTTRCQPHLVIFYGLKLYLVFRFWDPANMTSDVL
jgi:hypothetical protein